MISTIKSLLLSLLASFFIFKTINCLEGEIEPHHDPSLFSLKVESEDAKWNDKAVEACHQSFWAGLDKPACTWCYESGETSKGCSQFQNKTVFQADGKMKAEIPGGQFWFINPKDGRLKMTFPGKAAGHEVGESGNGISAKANYLVQDGKPDFWLGCPSSDEPDSLAIYAPESKVENCVKIKLLTSNVEGEHPGAYSYQ